MSIRFPADIAASMKILAEQNDRSINGEMVRAAREHIAHEKKKQERAQRT